jgi:hypothetical protein
MGGPAGPYAGGSIIRLRRLRGSRDFLRAYWVLIDGTYAGKITAGKTKDFVVPPGWHRLLLKIDGHWTSQEITLQLREGELAEFACRPGGSGPTNSFDLANTRAYINLEGPLPPQPQAPHG